MHKDILVDKARVLLNKNRVALYPFAKRLKSVGNNNINSNTFARFQLNLNEGEIFLGDIDISHTTENVENVWCNYGFSSNNNEAPSIDVTQILFTADAANFQALYAPFFTGAGFNQLAYARNSIYANLDNSIGDSTGATTERFEMVDKGGLGATTRRIIKDVWLNHFLLFQEFHPDPIIYINFVGYIAR